MSESLPFKDHPTTNPLKQMTGIQKNQQQQQQPNTLSKDQQLQKSSQIVTGTHMGHDVVEIDYEALPENSSIIAQLSAGAFAGIMEHTVMYPVDAIKTRMQSAKGDSLPKGIIASVSKISATEGAASLWRGVTSVVLGAGPAHAIYYLVFESTKTSLVNNLTNSQTKGIVTDEKYPLIASASGIAATITSDALMTPFDVIKQRMQLFQQSHKVPSTPVAAPATNATTASANAALKTNAVTQSNFSVWSVSKNIYKTEGLSTFFISYPTTLILNIPFAAINFGVYEWASSKLNPNQSYNPLLHCISGGVSGAAAAAVTTPFDCIKTILQTKNVSHDPSLAKINGFKEAAAYLYAKQGYAGFLRGLRPRVVFNVPSTAISWTAYEMAKAYISGNPV